MKEASPAKYYFAKYFFLAFGLLQWMCGLLILRESTADKSKASALLFFTVGLILVSIQVFIGPKLKRVAVGKNRIAIRTDGETRHYEWPEVKWIRPVPLVNAYKLKLKGKKERIYFLPSQKIDPVFGLSDDDKLRASDLRRK